MRYVFGIDVGGTTVKMGLFETTGNLVDKWEIPTRTEQNGIYILSDIAKSLEHKMILSKVMCWVLVLVYPAL